MSVWQLVLSIGAAVAGAMPPEPVDQAHWIGVKDYPPEAMVNGWDGATRFRLSIDASGAVKDCAVIASSGHPLLDRTTCSLMLERSRFHPATNARGDQVAGRIEQTMQWEIPQDPSMSWAVVRIAASGPECVVDNATRMESEPCESLVEAIRRAGVTLPARVQIGKRPAAPN